MRYEIGIDTGGTYTDAVVFERSERKIVSWAKSLTTKEDLSLGIGNALDGLELELVQQAGIVSLSTTLATNACVENKGGRAKLLFIGDNKKAVSDYGGEYGLPGADEIWFLYSRGTMQGEILEEPDWDAFLRDSAGWFNDASAVAVVELFAMWNNAILEKRARQVIESKYSLPVICGHDLFSGLNSIQRSASALLNARLIPIISEFLQATKIALHNRGIQVPVVIVRSDGSLMSEQFTSVRPVETLLCGPAASVMGGMELGGEKDCMIIDMGGTTTDIAIVQDGIPRRAAEGINIGRWRTFVKGLFIDTFGLGGDSEVRMDGHGGIELMPNRVIPLCVLASQWPHVVPKLRALVTSCQKHTQPLHEFYVLVKDIENNLNYTNSERAFCAALKDGPLIYIDAAPAAGANIYALNMRRLEKEGVIIRGGLTPTDIMHIKGDFNRFQTEASALGTQFVATCLNMSPEKLCDLVYNAVKRKLYCNIVRLLMEDEYPHYRKSSIGRGIEELIDESWNACRNGQKGFLKLGFGSSAALVGVGAPVHVFLPDVAKALGAECVIARNAPVANALGAVVGNVSATCEVEIKADYDVGGIKGFIVFGKRATFNVDNLDEAIRLATEDSKESALEEAKLRGALGDITVTVKHSLSEGHAKEDSILLGAKVVATAIGRITI